MITQHFPTREQPWRGHSAYQTLRRLSRLAEVEVFFPHSEYPRLLRPKSRIYDSLDASYSPPDVRAHYISYPVLPWISRPLNGWMGGTRLLPHVRRFAPDVIVSFVIYPDGYSAVQVGKALGVPVIVKAIGSDLNRIPGPMVETLTRSVLRKADYVTAVSEQLRLKSIAMGADRGSTRAIVNGCDLSVFHCKDRLAARRQLQIAEDREVVLYIGRLDLRKGLGELVEAAAQLQKRRPRLLVCMVGDGSDKPLLERQIAKLRAEEFIMLAPPCETAQVSTWMAASDLVTLPSYAEGCPNVVLEALASGRPVVATRVGGIPELMSDECGRLIPPHDVSALEDALDAVLGATWDDIAISRRWSRSWETVAEELMAICKTLAPERSAAV